METDTTFDVIDQGIEHKLMVSTLRSAEMECLSGDTYRLTLYTNDGAIQNSGTLVSLTAAVSACRDWLRYGTKLDDKPDADLPFPFVGVTESDIFLGNLRNYAEVKAALPAEFRSDRNPYNRAANHLFFQGCTVEEKRRLNYRASPSQQGYMWACIQCWLGSFEPSHEVKAAAVGWMLSLLLEDVPANWSR